MSALRIGLLALDGATLAEVVPVREQLEALGAQVTLVIPGGGSILPVTGRYYPAAGGLGVRCALSQALPADFDMVILPDGISGASLARQTQILEFIRGCTEKAESQPLPVFQIEYLLRLLKHGCNIAGLARTREGVLSGSARGR